MFKLAKIRNLKVTFNKTISMETRMNAVARVFIICETLLEYVVGMKTVRSLFMSI